MKRFCFKNVFLIVAVCLTCIMPSCQNKEEQQKQERYNQLKAQYDELDKQMDAIITKCNDMKNLQDVVECSKKSISIIDKQISLSQEMEDWNNVNALKNIKDQHLKVLQECHRWGY